MKKLIITLLAAFIASCEKIATQSAETVRKEGISINFVKEVESSGDRLIGLFEIVNNGNKATHVGIILDNNPAKCGFPVFERLVDESWVRIPVLYEGGVIFSPLDPRESAFFETALDQIKDYKGDEIRLLVASTKGFYYESIPFSLPVASKVDDTREGPGQRGR